MTATNMVRTAGKAHTALLFEACPKCQYGDLEIDCSTHGRVLATCLACDYSGELRSVYGITLTRRRHLQAIWRGKS